MKLRLLALILALSAAGAARADSVGYAYCGSFDAYVLLYKTTDQIEELGKLRCDEKVEVLTRWTKFFQVRTADGRVGWVRSADISGTPGSARRQATPFGLTEPTRAPAPATELPLDNRDILKMRGMRLSDGVIISKIKSSKCDFDTSPAALQKLRSAGLPDQVILAMIQAPHASDEPATKPVDTVDVNIPDGTAIAVVQNADISSDGLQQGTIVKMTVVQDVVVNGLILFQRGAEARARVIAITEPGRMGHPGAVSWAMQDVDAANGDLVPIDFTSTVTSANPSGGVAAPSAPVWEFRKNKPTVMPAGQHFQAVVHGNVVLKLTPELAKRLSAPPPVAQSSVSAAVAPASNQ
ncbi:MAG: SH3 domain-containing protein [Candidatus Acidiferrales bacterium]